MIHVRNSAQRNLDAERFNESFMMHTSTSPHYGVIAACDVASKMMEGDAGRSLVQEMHDEAIAFRRAMLHVRDDLDRDDWWFSVWQPTQVERSLDKGDTRHRWWPSARSGTCGRTRTGTASRTWLTTMC